MGVKISELPLNTNPTLSSAVIPMVDGGVTYRVTLYDVVVPSLSALDLKEPIQTPVTQPEAEAGTESALRSWSPLRVGEAIVAKSEVVTVADKTARKNPASYTSVYVGMRVTQTDENVLTYPTLEYALNGTDVTLDSNWFVRPLANPETGELIVDLRLADFADIIPPANSIGQVDGELRVGNGVVTGGKFVGAAIPTFILNSTLGIMTLLTSEVIEDDFAANEDIRDPEFNNPSRLIIGSNVTAIGDRAFQNAMTLRGPVIIPPTVTSIGSYSFSYTLITNLTIPSGVVIDTAAFFYTPALAGVTIPSGVTLGFAAFQLAGGSGNVIIESGVVIGEAAFRTSGFTGNLTVGSDIGVEAFSGAGFTGSLTLGSGVTTIGSLAFYNCAGFTGSLTIPSSVTSIGSYAFKNSGFTGSLTLPSSVTYIGSDAFYNCAGFTGSLILGSGVTTIGSYAFYNCAGFTGSLTIPSGVVIGFGAFVGCSGLTGLTIESGVTLDGDVVFINCSGISNLIFGSSGSSVTVNGSTVFQNAGASGGNVTIRSTVVSNALFSSSLFTGSLTIDSGVTTIEDNAFDGVGFTGSLTLPSSVTYIGSYAFYNCSGFTGSLTLPSGDIGIGAFIGCTGFTGILTLGAGVTSVSDHAFYNCSGFTGLTIPPSVTNIYTSAFDGCSAITNVQCRVTKTIIDDAPDAFLNTGITTINVLTSDVTWTAGAGQTIAGKSGITVIKDLV